MMGMAAPWISLKKYNPFHDKAGRFAEAPWGAGGKAVGDRYAEEIAPVAQRAMALEAKNSKAGLLSSDEYDEEMNGLMKTVQETRGRFYKDLGLTGREATEADRLVSDWVTNPRQNGDLAKALASGKSRPLGAAALWSQTVLQGAGVKQLTVYRGVDGDYGRALARAKAQAGPRGKIKVEAYALSPYSMRRRIADSFGSGPGGVTMTRTIPAGQVLLHHLAFPEAQGLMHEVTAAGGGFEINASGITVH